MNRGTAQNDPLTALRAVNNHPRQSDEPYLTTVSNLAREAGHGVDLHAFCCAGHWVAVDDILKSLMNRTASRVSQPDRR